MRVLGAVAGLVGCGALLVWMPGPVGYGVAWLRLEAWRGWYEAQVRALPAQDGGMALWRWGTVGWGGSVYQALVHDPADGLALPPDSWDAAWVRRMGLLVTAGDSASGEALRHAVFRPLGGHFYWMTEEWGGV